ncbi:MAG: DUF4276 family protein [Planctomycetia bacterium]
MKRIALYVEGGGDSATTQAMLRAGFDELLKDLKASARAKQIHWKTALSGSRNQTFHAFQNELWKSDGSVLCILLVDSEEAVVARENVDDADTRKLHLVARDKWDLANVDATAIHLMVQTMEAWIVADPEALKQYYGANFHAQSLPARENLEEEPKVDLTNKLAKATKDTVKGVYAKIEHASKLLERIDPDKIAARCPRFQLFRKWLSDRIAAV